MLAVYSRVTDRVSMSCRVALLDVIITKISGEEPPPKDDIPVFLSHAELVASTFIEQCKMVLQLPSEPPAADEVRGTGRQPSAWWGTCVCTEN